MRRTAKTKPRPSRNLRAQAFARALCDGKTISEALAAAGAPASTCARGWASVSPLMRREVVREEKRRADLKAASPPETERVPMGTSAAVPAAPQTGEEPSEEFRAYCLQQAMAGNSTYATLWAKMQGLLKSEDYSDAIFLEFPTKGAPDDRPICEACGKHRDFQHKDLVGDPGYDSLPDLGEYTLGFRAGEELERYRAKRAEWHASLGAEFPSLAGLPTKVVKTPTESEPSPAATCPTSSKRHPFQKLAYEWEPSPAVEPAEPLSDVTGKAPEENRG